MRRNILFLWSCLGVCLFTLTQKWYRCYHSPPGDFCQHELLLFESLSPILVLHHHFFRGRAIRRKRWFSLVPPLKLPPRGKVKSGKEFRGKLLSIWSPLRLLLPSSNKGGGLLRVNWKQPLLHKGKDKAMYILSSLNPFVGLDWVCCYSWGFWWT